MSSAFVSLPSTIVVLLIFSAGDSFTFSLFTSISPSIPLSYKKQPDNSNFFMQIYNSKFHFFNKTNPYLSHSRIGKEVLKLNAPVCSKTRII